MYDKKHLKIIIMVSLILLVVILLCIFALQIPVLVVNYIYILVNDLFGNGKTILGMAAAIIVVGAFVTIVIFFFWVIFYIIQRIALYVSFIRICLFREYKLRLTRFPFASLFGMSEKGDISVSSYEGILVFHFLDILRPLSKALTIPNDREYVITPIQQTKQPKTRNNGAPVLNGSGLVKNKDKIKSFPKVENKNKVKHILIIQTVPTHARLMKGGEAVTIGNGERIANMTYYSIAHIKKGLKKKLYNSLFDSKRVDNEKIDF